jgi:hypothetical protein
MWPLIIGALMKYGADAQATQRQDHLRQAMLAYQRSQAQNNTAAIGEMTAKQTPDARQTELQGIQAARVGSATQAVNTVQPAAPTSVAGAAQSPDYQKAQAAAADTVANRTKRAIQQMSVMGAPGEAGLASGIRFGRAAGKVDAGNQAISNVGNAYLTSIGNAVPNPALSMGGSALMAYGSAGGNFGGGTTQPEQVGGPGMDKWNAARTSRWPKSWGATR